MATPCSWPGAVDRGSAAPGGAIRGNCIGVDKQPRSYGRKNEMTGYPAQKKSATGDVALKVTTKGGWRSVPKHLEVIQYITSFLNTE
jgi:hypothetical protein